MHDSSHSRKHVARAQPWLGTFVEIRVECANQSRWQVMSALDAAFAEVATIHRLMSRQQHGTDVGALGAAAVGETVAVDPRTAEVLYLALELQRESEGRFDIERREPGMRVRRRKWPGPAWSIAGPDAVRVLRRAELDLDGIAKGYAVDRAISILESRALGATVNAGGDLRTCSGWNAPLLVRVPRGAGALVDLGWLSSGAFASSQAGAQPRGGPELAGTGIDDRRPGKRALPTMTVGVAASTCATADALTKVVAVDPEFAARMLWRHRASAWMLRESAGEMLMQCLGVPPSVKLDAA